MAFMKTIQKIENNKAWERFVRIAQMRSYVDKVGLLIGAELLQVKNNQEYLSLDIDSFEAYLAQPEIAIAERTAYRMMRVARVYLLDLRERDENGGYIDIPEEQIELYSKIGVSKLDIIAGIITPTNAHYWLNSAATLSRSDLETAIRGEEVLPRWQQQAEEIVSACKRLWKNPSTPPPIQNITREYLVKLIQYVETLTTYSISENK